MRKVLVAFATFFFRSSAMAQMPDPPGQVKPGKSVA
jgi:hypothetical protein